MSFLISLQSGFWPHPTSELLLSKINNGLCVAESSGQSSVIIWLDLSALDKIYSWNTFFTWLSGCLTFSVVLLFHWPFLFSLLHWLLISLLMIACLETQSLHSSSLCKLMTFMSSHGIRSNLLFTYHMVSRAIKWPSLCLNSQMYVSCPVFSPNSRLI